ncbi:MAG: YidB family protein [Casimicrobiaceae bacterium]
MGLLDGLLDNLMGRMPAGNAGTQGGNSLIQIALQMLQQNGGIQGVLAKMQQAGYGQQAQSWIGTGANQSISPDVMSQIFGQGQLNEIAQRLGMSRQEAAGGLAQALPEVVDGMTPNGHVADDHIDIVAQALAMLQNTRK